MCFLYKESWMPLMVCSTVAPFRMFSFFCITRLILFTTFSSHPTSASVRRWTDLCFLHLQCFLCLVLTSPQQRAYWPDQDSFEPAGKMLILLWPLPLCPWSNLVFVHVSMDVIQYVPALVCWYKVNPSVRAVVAGQMAHEKASFV